MYRQPPGKKLVLAYLLVGLLLVALASVVLGGATWFRLVRLLVIYGGAFLLVAYVLSRLRNTH